MTPTRSAPSPAPANPLELPPSPPAPRPDPWLDGFGVDAFLTGLRPVRA